MNNEIKKYCEHCKFYSSLGCQSTLICKDGNKFLAADVQPVDRWINVKDRLPEDNKPVLCFVIDTTGEGSSYVIGSCEHSEFWFLKIGDNKRFSFPHMQIKVTHWQPLPEPPKDGDTE
jgi:hypothetical protein